LDLFTGLEKFELNFRTFSSGDMELDAFVANAKVTYQYEQVPEPASAALAGLALLALVGARYRQRKCSESPHLRSAL
jgi:MYXO-CTERM domain-containing protein